MKSKVLWSIFAVFKKDCKDYYSKTQDCVYRLQFASYSDSLTSLCSQRETQWGFPPHHIRQQDLGYSKETVIVFILLLLRLSHEREYENKEDPLWCCCVVSAFDPAVVTYYTCTWTGNSDEEERPLSASSVTLFILIYPQPTQERSGQTYALNGLGHISREMYTNSYTSSWLYSACVLSAAGVFLAVLF